MTDVKEGLIFGLVVTAGAWVVATNAKLRRANRRLSEIDAALENLNERGGALESAFGREIERNDRLTMRIDSLGLSESHELRARQLTHLSRVRAEQDTLTERAQSRELQRELLTRINRLLKGGHSEH